MTKSVIKDENEIVFVGYKISVSDLYFIVNISNPQNNNNNPIGLKILNNKSISEINTI